MLQDICPARLIEHFTILMDNLTYELVLQALDNPSVPPDPALLPASICNGSLYMPGIDDPATAIAALQGFGGFLLGFAVAIPEQGVAAEPPLRSYTTNP